MTPPPPACQLCRRPGELVRGLCPACRAREAATRERLAASVMGKAGPWSKGDGT